MIVLSALVFVFVLGGLAAATADLLVLENQSAMARDAAFLGAQAGGSQVDIGSAGSTDVPTTGTLTLDASAATVCQRAVAHADPGSTATCSVAAGTITVDVTQEVKLPLGLFGSTATVRAHARGGPAAGTVTASQ